MAPSAAARSIHAIQVASSTPTATSAASIAMSRSSAGAWRLIQRSQPATSGASVGPTIAAPRETSNRGAMLQSARSRRHAWACATIRA